MAYVGQYYEVYFLSLHNRVVLKIENKDEGPALIDILQVHSHPDRPRGFGFIFPKFSDKNLKTQPILIWRISIQIGLIDNQVPIVINHESRGGDFIGIFRQIFSIGKIGIRDAKSDICSTRILNNCSNRGIFICKKKFKQI